MQTKFIEIRDSGTCIAALALRMVAEDNGTSAMTESRFMRRAGFGQEFPSVILMRLEDQKATCDLYSWHSLGMGLRTMQNAHNWINEHWDEIESGQVVDVQYILNETTMPKTAEIGVHALAELLWPSGSSDKPAEGPSEDPSALCSDCPPVGYPTDRTRCTECPRREPSGEME